MHLDLLGFGPFSASFHALARPDLVPARVVAPLGAALAVTGAPCERAELSGRLRHELAAGELPTAGDWVALAPAAGIIHHVLPRRTVLFRRAAGKVGEPQAVAANVDTFLVVTSANRDANARRLERYLAAIAESGAAVAIVVNKVDLCEPEDVAAIAAELGRAGRGAPVIPVSAATGAGLDGLDAYVRPGQTVGLVGMSGVGKSSIANRLLGAARQEVLPIDENDRGRHATTRRELLVLPGGGILIDTPGMRSFGLADDGGGVAAVFEDVLETAAACRFRDCRHAGEPGCAVAAAIDDGALDPDRLEAMRKLDREARAAELRHDRAAAARWRRENRARLMAIRAQGKANPKR